MDFGLWQYLGMAILSLFCFCLGAISQRKDDKRLAETVLGDCIPEVRLEVWRAYWRAQERGDL